jgi:hypothetical protein
MAAQYGENCSTSVTTGKILKLKFEVLTHPAYSPDIAPSDYNIFGLLKDKLCRCRFTNKEVKDAVHLWFCMQP